MQLLAEVPSTARSFEWTVPTVGTPAHGADQFLRVIATDDLGQEGIADVPLKVSNLSDFTGSMTQNPVFPSVVRPGDSQPVCAQVSGSLGSLYASLELDNDDSGVSLGGVFASGGQACTVLPAQVTDVSTDRARIRFDATASLNQVRSYDGPYFSIRPDPLLADAAPQVSLSSTHTGQTYPAGSNIALAWTASDDEGPVLVRLAAVVLAPRHVVGSLSRSHSRVLGVVSFRNSLTRSRVARGDLQATDTVTRAAPSP